ncbi:MAG: hypothetical protein Q4E69_03315 [Bacilli bacterium]|nr:hypothetical protein [Bacilli bacterium]
MLDKNVFLKLKRDLQATTDSNYSELLGFLQRFYAINVVREVVGEDESLKEEVPTLVRSYLEELYNSESAKKYINGLINISDDSLRMRATTLALMETVFPEFLDGSFNPNGVNDERREMASMIFTTSETYKGSSDAFKEGFGKAMKRTVDRSGYGEARISPELKELLYEDYRPVQR